MIWCDVEQNSSEWLKARLGIPTASNFHRILTPKTLKVSRQANDYLAALLGEWMTNSPAPEGTTIWSTAMEDGIEREEESLRYFELTTGLSTAPGGFCLTDDRLVGCSPDRFVLDTDGKRVAVLELKNPTAKVQIKRLLRLEGEEGEAYVLQRQGQLYVTGLSCHYFLSYYPGLPPLLEKTGPDPVYQAAMKEALAFFCEWMEKSKGVLRKIQ